MVIISDAKIVLEDVFRFAHLDFPGLTKLSENSKEFEFSFAQHNARGRLTYIYPNGNNQEMLLVDLPTYERPKAFPIQICIIRLGENFKIISTIKAEKLAEVPEPFLRFWIHLLHKYFFYKGKIEAKDKGQAVP